MTTPRPRGSGRSSDSGRTSAGKGKRSSARNSGSGRSADLLGLRLHASRLVGAPFASALEAVTYFGAVQAQDLPGAQWALGQRVAHATQATLNVAYDTDLIRTHVLRPTWHFVAPADLRWLLALTAPRVKRALATYDRRLALDDRVYARCNTVLARALEPGVPLTRAELAQALARARIAADGQRLAHIVIHAELDAIVCSGPRRGTQLTYTLVDRRCPPAPEVDRATAVAKLAARYFASHGPALAADFAWWSGLTLSDARAGIAALGPALQSRTIDDQTYWLAAAASPPATRGPVVHLLPNFDESIVAYRHRSVALSPALAASLGARANLLFHNLITLDGTPIGTWRRATPAQARADGSPVVTNIPTALPAPAQRAVAAAIERYAGYAASAPAPEISAKSAKRQPAHR